jgi:hypothetical protein
MSTIVILSGKSTAIVSSKKVIVSSRELVKSSWYSPVSISTTQNDNCLIGPLSFTRGFDRQITRFLPIYSVNQMNFLFDNSLRDLGYICYPLERVEIQFTRALIRKICSFKPTEKNIFT